MALDTNIALGVKPVEQPNMLAQMGQMMQMRQMQQGYESENALRDFYAQGGDISTAEGKRQLMSKVGLKGAEIIDRQSQTRSRDVGTAEKSLELYKNQVGFIKTPEDAARWLSNFYRNPETRPYVESIAPMDVALAAIPTNDPAKFQEWLRNASLKSEKLFVDANTIATNQTRIQAANIATGPAYARLAEDKIPLALDDATVDLVANRYLIDGTLPPLGMGKPAATLRAKILDRAQAIATAPPKPAPNANNLNTSAATQNENTVLSPTVNPNALLSGNTSSSIMQPNAPAGTVFAPPALAPSAAAPVTTPVPVGVTPQQAAKNIITSKTDTATQKRALTDFSTGIQGRMVNSMNTAVEHLSTLTELADALKNNDLRAINTVGNLVAKQTGSAAPTNFAAARQIVAQEIVKAIVANGGTGREREEAAANIAAAGSPEQLAGVISTYQELLAGQLKSLGLQYKNTTGRDDFNTKLLPSTLRALSRVEAATPAKTGDIASDAGVAKVVGSNTVTTPDGKSYTFPNAEAANAFKKKIGQ